MRDRENLAQIPLNENAVYVVANGALYIAPKPQEGFGKQIITWQDGKPLPRIKYESVLDSKEIK